MTVRQWLGLGATVSKPLAVLISTCWWAVAINIVVLLTPLNGDDDEASNGDDNDTDVAYCNH